MQPATEQLIKKMQDDKDFAEKILTCKENDEAIALAKEQGIDLTPENIVEVYETLQLASRIEEGELSEEELEQVAGGMLSVTLLVSALALVAISTISALSILGPVGSAIISAEIGND